MCGLKQPPDPNVIIGLEDRDDAGVYRLREDLAVIEHLDFFTPIVDDPYTFGQIAAANALSDIYAKGGRPVTAMNIVCFPGDSMDTGVLREILRGGLDKLTEAKTVLIGGHSVTDKELKYGLSVTGVIHPAKVITKAGARVGDVLVLTKPIGTGIVSTAQKAGEASEEAVTAATVEMTRLNRRAAELMLEAGAHAATDVTGFGLLGIVCEMAAGAHGGITIDTAAVPLLPGTLEYARAGFIPGGTGRNRDFRKDMTELKDVPDEMSNILFDPQTSGGLLIALPEEAAAGLLRRLHDEGMKEAAVIGRVVPHSKGKVIPG